MEVRIILLCLLCVVLIICSLIFWIYGGENGYKHKCENAFKCPANVRCANEKEMECYREKIYNGGK